MYDRDPQSVLAEVRTVLGVPEGEDIVGFCAELMDRLKELDEQVKELMDELTP